MKLALVFASAILCAACVSDRQQAPRSAVNWSPTPYRIDLSVPAPDLYVPEPRLYVPLPDLAVPGFTFDGCQGG